MKTLKILLIPLMIIFLVAVASASSVTISLFYDSTNADSLTITNGESVGVILSADSIFEESMSIKLDLFDSNRNLSSNVVKILDAYTTLDSYSKHLMIGQAAYLGQGNYTLRAIVIRASGQSDTDTLSLEVLLPPTINHAPIITSTPVTQVNEGQVYNYQVTATDADGDALTYSLTQAPSWLSMNSNGLITGTASDVDSDSQYSITAKVSDGRGGIATQSYVLTIRNVIIDTTPPIITVISPVNGQTYTSSNVLLEMTSNENASSAWYVLDNRGDSQIDRIPDSYNHFRNSVSLGDGTHNIVFYVRDRSGNLGQSSVITFYIDTTIPPSDTTAPVITVVSPVNWQTNGYPTVYFDIRTNENVNSAWYVLNGGNNISMNSVSATRFTSIVSLSDGTYSVVFYARDLAGNVGQSNTVNFVIDTTIPPSDTTAPVVTISSPTNGATYTSHRTQIIFTATDTNLDRCWYRLNNGPNVNTACNAPITGITSVSGTNTWRVYAIDTAGNQGSATITFTVNIPSGPGGGGPSNKNIGAKYISDKDGTKQYLEQFIQKTITEEEEVLAVTKQPVLVRTLWIWLLGVGILILITALIILWRRR